MNFSDRIGSAADNDRHNLWEFSRSSGLPRGYFDRPRITPNDIVFAVCAVIGAVLLILGMAE